MRGDVAVDHFVPWRRYPFDLGHNFVLAHPTCNGRKGDRLAAVDHLRRWDERNRNRLYELPKRFTDSALVHAPDPEPLQPRGHGQPLVERDQLRVAGGPGPDPGGGELKRVRGPERMDAEQARGAIADIGRGDDLRPGLPQRVQEVQ
jgi:hypothetical protein